VTDDKKVTDDKDKKDNPKVPAVTSEQ